MTKIAHIVGARPQFIKFSPVSKAAQAFDRTSEAINNILIHTGQHYDYSLSKIFFDELGIKEPDYHLGVGSGSQAEQTSQVIKKVEEVLVKEKPDFVLVYGDTNSTLGGALAACKLHQPIAHVEAGLRSFNKYMPEEINRILTDHVSSILFCPSKIAVDNLLKEGFENVLNDSKLVPLNYLADRKIERNIQAGKNNPLIVNIGDAMYDVLQFAVSIAEKKSKILQKLKLKTRDYCLLTLHRAENTDNLEKLEEIIDFVNDKSEGKTVILPIHPRTRKVYEKAKRKFLDNVIIIDPVGYFDILMLLMNCIMVMTDSGGMQKEAYWLKVPCITLRDETEWLETVDSGWNILYKNYNSRHNPSHRKTVAYGDGRASERMINVLLALKHKT